MINELTLRKPDLLHLHLRDDELLNNIVNFFDYCGRGLCIGNLVNPIETGEQALTYKQRIISAGAKFEPLMCIMLTRNTTPEVIAQAKMMGINHVKFMPVGISTNANSGYRLDDYQHLGPLFQAIIDNNMYLLVHAEVEYDKNGKRIDPLYREDAAVPVIKQYLHFFPDLNIVIEHVSTARMVNLIESQPLSVNIAATVTPQHALLTYDQVFGNDPYKPLDVYSSCLPVVKREADRLAVYKFMTSGSPRVFAGPDNASHWIWQKTGETPPYGITFGPSDLLWYLHIFDKAGALKKIDDFLSFNGAMFYNLQLNKETIRVVRSKKPTPKEMNGVRFCLGGEVPGWEIVGQKMR